MSVCPRCGGQNRHSIAPGFYECAGTVVAMLPDPATGHFAPHGFPCTFRYQDDAAATSITCACGTFAIGLCVTCGNPVCGDHSVGGAQRLCARCEQARQEEAARQAEQAAEDAQNAHVAHLAMLADLADPTERLLRTMRYLTGRAEMTTWYRYGYADDLAGVCIDLWPDGDSTVNLDLSNPPWDSSAIALWFVCRAEEAGLRPAPSYQPWVRRTRWSSKYDLSKELFSAWHLENGSTRVAKSDRLCDAYLLPDGRVMPEPDIRSGLKPQPCELNYLGLVVLADILDLPL